MGLEPTTSTLRVRRAIHCVTPPLRGVLTVYSAYSDLIVLTLSYKDCYSTFCILINYLPFTVYA